MTKKQMAWIEIKIGAPQILKDSLVNRLFEVGAHGVEEKELTDGSVSISAYYDEAVAPSAGESLSEYIKDLGDLFPWAGKVEWQSLQVKTEDWAESYKAFYKAQKLTPMFFLRPAWDLNTLIPHGMIPIVMDPKQAFGTGLHPTTRLCLRRIERLISFYPKQSQIHFLDVGTGSGILSIGAFKLGIKKITATDLDKVALAAAKENFELNGCTGIELSDLTLEKIGGQFHVIASNILLQTHLELKQHYQRLLLPEGHLILSGVLTAQKQELCDALMEVGLVSDSWEALDEWASVLFRRQDKF